MKRNETIAPVLIAIGVFCPTLVFADGIDLVAYFSRTPCENIALAIPLVFLLMGVNYALNFVVIGLPAHRFGSLPLNRISRSLIWLTLFGQVADRIGAVLSGLLVDPVTNFLGLTGEGAWVAPLLGMTFIFSALSVGLLAFVFARYRWTLSRKHSLGISVAAGILTNPAWAMGTWFLG
jgi:hypothetical protein